MSANSKGMVDFSQLLSEYYGQLTKSEKRIANYIRKNQEESAFLAAGELAERLRLSEATMVRFARTLGFNSYPSMRAVLQENFRRRVTQSARLRSRLDDLRETGDIFEQGVRQRSRRKGIQAEIQNSSFKGNHVRFDCPVQPVQMIKFLMNPKKVAVSGWNQGIRSASWDLILIAGAHSVYPKDYVKNCVEWSDRAENVGGGIVSAVRQDVSALSRSVVIARDDIFEAGNSTFRQNSEKAVFVDTVFGGCYRREVFEKIGLFNEKLQRSGDLEFNLRLKEAGMKTLYVPEIKSTYFARTNWWDFVKHNFKDGKWSLLMMRYSKVKFGMRRMIPAQA